MNCGERSTSQGKRRFALIGVDLVQASPDDIDHLNVGGGELVVVEVTDPAAPRILSRTPGSTSTHTVACVKKSDCTFAYSAGDSNGKFSIFDLRKLSKPREVDANPRKAGIQPFSSPTAGHKWNFAAAASATTPAGTAPRSGTSAAPPTRSCITTTGAAGRGEDPRYAGYNDFIHHNSFRPNPGKFRAGAQAVVAERQRAAGDRGGLRADRLRPGRLVPDLVGQAPRRHRGTRSCRSTRWSSPTCGNFPLPAGRVLLGALVRLQQQRHRRGRLLRRRHPVPRRPQPARHQVLRPRHLGRLGGLGRDVAAGLQPQGH